ncbi:TadE family protein [Nocardiopsis sp. LOL_012]|uniref:TadE family protein n=1 Tax=Nocardiopsis sp. LOL_012 TaxID=3345409 RepID=UPI003A872F4C
MNRQHRRNGDEGHASVFLILLMPVVIIVFALVWEAGQMLAAKSELLATAHEAARAGTHQIDERRTLERGAPVMDPGRARRAAARYLHDTGATGTVQAREGQVAVVARTTYTPALLPIGPRVIEARATASALQPPPG